MNKFFCFLFALSLILSSCGYRSQVSPYYLYVDSLLDVNPELGFSLLEKKDTKLNDAEFALLLTKGYEKNDLQHTNDSLVNIPVEYYKNSSNVELKAKSFYYLGRVHQDLGDEINAVKAFLESLNVLGEKEETYLHLLINSNLAASYLDQGLYEKALERYQNAHRIARELNLKRDTFFPLRGIGSLYLLFYEPDSALTYYHKALSIAEELNDSLLSANILCDIACLYNDQNDHFNANTYITRSINAVPQDEPSEPYYFLKGNVMSQLHQLDSARYYLSRSLLSDNLYTRTVASFTLYDLEKKLGNYKKATEFADEYITSYDSIQQQVQRAEIVKLMDDYALETHKKEITDRQHRIIMYLIIAFLFFLSVCVYIFFLFDRKKKEKLINIQQDLMHNRSQLLQLRNVLESSNSQLEQNRQETEQLKIELENRQRELCLRLFKSNPSYKIIQDYTNQKKQMKHPRVLSDAERGKVEAVVNEIYVDYIQGLKLSFPSLSAGDLYCCTLAYIGFSNTLVAYLMGVDLNVATQRRYRIKSKMDENTFNSLFNSNFFTS